MAATFLADGFGDASLRLGEASGGLDGATSAGDFDRTKELGGMPLCCRTPRQNQRTLARGTTDEKSSRDNLRLAYRYRYFTVQRTVPVRAGTDPYSQSQTHAPGPKYSTSRHPVLDISICAADRRALRARPRQRDAGRARAPPPAPPGAGGRTDSTVIAESG